MKPIKTFIIRNKQTKEQWQADSGKTSWRAVNHAKAAWKRSDNNVPKHLKRIDKWDMEQCPRFDDQDEFEVVELKPDNPLTEHKEEIKDIFDYYHSGLYNDESQRFEHFWKELYQLLE